MPYRDPERQAAAQRRYRARRLDAARERERNGKRVARGTLPGDVRGPYRPRVLSFRWDLDLQPEHARSCNHRFFAPGRCLKRAEWISSTATRWCDEHAEGLPGLHRIED